MGVFLYCYYDKLWINNLSKFQTTVNYKSKQ
jgi:hypothetical protein